MIQIPANEKILLVLRKHWFVLFMEGMMFLALAVAPILLIPLKNLLAIPIPEWLTAVSWLAYLLWLIALWIGFFIFWTDFYLDIWIITDKRIIDIEQKGLFSRTTSALRHDNIQDSTISQGGLIATMLGFGTIKIQSAAADIQITIPYATSPQKVKELIMHLHDITLDKAKTVRLATEDIVAIRESSDSKPDLHEHFPAHHLRKK